MQIALSKRKKGIPIYLTVGNFNVELFRMFSYGIQFSCISRVVSHLKDTFCKHRIQTRFVHNVINNIQLPILHFWHIKILLRC